MATKTVSENVRKAKAVLSGKKVRKRRTNPRAVERRYYRYIALLRRGLTRAEAATKAHIALSTVKRFERERGGYERNRRTGEVVLTVENGVKVLTSDGKLHEGVALDAVNRSRIGRYWNSVKSALRNGDPVLLKTFRGMVIYDLHGRSYKLMTKLKELNSVFAQMTPQQLESFEDKFYRRIRDAA